MWMGGMAEKLRYDNRRFEAFLWSLQQFGPYIIVMKEREVVVPVGSTAGPIESMFGVNA
jgi:hypothetical protein